MGLLKGLTLAAFDLATAPIDLAKDVLTLGGVATEQDKPYTLQKLEQIRKDIEEA